MGYSPIPGGTIIGDMTDGGGLAAAFDGVTSQTHNQSAKAPGGEDEEFGYAGKTLAAPKVFGKALIHAANNGDGFADNNGDNVRLRVRGRNGSAPASRTDGTILAEIGPFNSSANQIIELVSTDIETEWDHLWVDISIGLLGGGQACIAEVRLFSYYPSGLIGLLL